MTQYKTMWVRCPKCFHCTGIGSNTFKWIIEGDTSEFCKCGKDIALNIKESIEDYEKFKLIICNLLEKDKKDNKVSNLITDLLDLYDKVVFA